MVYSYQYKVKFTSPISKNLKNIGSYVKKKTSPILLILIVLVLVVLGIVACSILDEDTADPALSDTTESETVDVTEDVEETETDEIVENKEPATSESDPTSSTSSQQTENDDTWLVMLYQDADDPTLEEDIFTDLNEAEKVGSSDKVSIVAQIDRYAGAFKGKQNFTSAKRFFLTRDDDLEKLNSEEIEDLGEVNMASGQTLIDFATWAIESYPADHYVLILSDHGTGWPGGWTDPKPENSAEDALISGFDDMLFLQELDDAYAQIIEKTGIGKFEMIGYDACLMASIEVLSATAPYAHYAVLSQEVEPSMGWAYSAFLNKLVKDPGMAGAELAKTTVDSYIVEDSIVVDAGARAKYIASYYDGNISIADLKNDLTKTVTLSAIDLEAMPELISSLDNLAVAMSKINQKVVAAARTRTRAFESIYSEDEPSPYIDLGHFVKLIQSGSSSKAVSQAADEVKAAMKTAVIAEMHGTSKKSSTGISIYFPTSNLFEEEGSDYATYTNIASRFSDESLWDDFLTSHYTGKTLKANNKPDRDVKMVGPGASKITISPIELSSETASEGNPSTLSSTISGDNISFIYIFTGRFDETDAVQIVDIDYIDAEATLDMDGTIYPDWGEAEIPIDFDWEPVEYFITDGENSVLALLNPDSYGVGLDDTIYTVDGFYTLAEDTSKHYARLFFDGNGDLLKVMGYVGTEGSGPQHEITMQEGDQFTVLDKSIPTDENETAEYLTKESGTLTFNGTPWVWDQQTAPNGDYVVGFIAEDMDGNTYEEYAEITVE